MIRKLFVVGLDFAKIPLSQVKTSVIQASLIDYLSKAKI